MKILKVNVHLRDRQLDFITSLPNSVENPCEMISRALKPGKWSAFTVEEVKRPVIEINILDGKARFNGVPNGYKVVVKNQDIGIEYTN